VNHYNVDVTVSAPEDLSKKAVLRAVRRLLEDDGEAAPSEIYPVMVQRAIQVKR